MSETVRTSDFYDINAVKERLSVKLMTGEWPNIRNTDLGQALLNFGANVVSQEATAFFTAMEQMFLSTCSEQGYMEAIAKNFAIVPETVRSTSVNVTMRFAADRVFEQHDLSIILGSHTFYSIEPLTFSAGQEQTVVLFEGELVRQSSIPHQPSLKEWSYSQMPAPLIRTLGQQNIQRYLVLPQETFVPSITVSVTSGSTAQVMYWQRVNTWFGYGNHDRIYVVEKDFIGRYWIVFGDGEFGAIYPVGSYVNLRYLVSSGTNVEVNDFSRYRIYDQGHHDITDIVHVPDGGVSELVMGQDSIRLNNLREEIYNKQTSFQRLVRLEDYKKYLKSRNDVLDSVVISERDSNPPNQEMFNVLLYATKPLSPFSVVNHTDIAHYVSRYGLQTVEFQSMPLEFHKFNFWAEVAATPGYSISPIITSVWYALDYAYSWNLLGFEENINTQKAAVGVMGVEGIDYANSSVIVEAVYTNTVTTDHVFNFDVDDKASLMFSPRRYGVVLSSNAFSGVPYGRCVDNGDGLILGDFAGQESFTTFDASGRTVNTDTGLLMFADGSDTIRVLNGHLLSGAVSSIELAHNASKIAYNKYKDILYAVDVVDPSSDVSIYSYILGKNRVTHDHPTFIQKHVGLWFDHTSAVSVDVALLADATSIGAVAYFNAHLYVVVNYVAAASRVYRYALDDTGGLATTHDATYSAELSDLTFFDAEPIENQYGDGTNSLWLACAGGVAGVGDNAATDPAAFSGNGGTGWHGWTYGWLTESGTNYIDFPISPSSTDPVVIEARNLSAIYDFGAGNATEVVQYTVRHSYLGAAPVQWKLYGSNNGSDWTLLHHQSTDAVYVSSYSQHTIPAGNTAAYRYYRIVWTLSNSSSSLRVRSLQLFPAGASGEGGIYVVDSFDTITPEAVRAVVDSTTITCLGADETKGLFYGTSLGKVAKMYAMTTTGVYSEKVLVDDEDLNVQALQFWRNPNDVLSLGNLYFADSEDNVLYRISPEVEDQDPILRAGQPGVTTAADSIYEAATIDYYDGVVTLSVALPGASISYQVIGDLAYRGAQVAVLNQLVVTEKA